MKVTEEWPVEMDRVPQAVKDHAFESWYTRLQTNGVDSAVSQKIRAEIGVPSGSPEKVTEWREANLPIVDAWKHQARLRNLERIYAGTIGRRESGNGHAKSQVDAVEKRFRELVMEKVTPILMQANYSRPRRPRMDDVVTDRDGRSVSINRIFTVLAQRHHDKLWPQAEADVTSGAKVVSSGVSFAEVGL